MAEQVFVCAVFQEEDHDCVTTVHRTLKGAQRVGAAAVHAALHDKNILDVIQDELDGDEDEFQEFRDNMDELFAREDYNAVVELWDEWRANVDGLAFNFYITPTEVQE